MTGAWPGEQPLQPRPTSPPPTQEPDGRLITVRRKRCCRAVLAGERCDCAAVIRQIRRRPVIHFTTTRRAAA